MLEIVHGDRAAGINLLRELASQDQQEIQARSLLLGTREIRTDRAAAERLLGELRQAEGESGLWWRLRQASLWLSSKDWSAKQQEMTNSLRYCIEADPAWSAPVLLLAGMYERLGDFRRVEDVCRQGLLANPAAADIADRLLALLERQGRFADAEKVLQQVQINPRLASAWQVRVALGAKDLPRAIDELKVRASNDKQDAISRIQLARLIYQETKDADQAFEYLKQAEAIAPDSRTLVATRASILRGEGKSAEALQALDGYVARHNEFDAYWMRVVYLAEAGNLDRAEEDYKKLTGFTQNAAVGYELLGNFYAGTVRLDAGVAALEKGLSTYPDDLRLQRRLMQMLLQRAQGQDREKALGLLAALEERLPQDTELMMARALESNPGHPALLSARARAELALGYTPMATKLAREALAQDPNSGEALGVIVDAALNTKDRTLLEEVRRLVESALGRAPTSERFLISRAHVLAALEIPKTAIAQLEAYCQSQAGSRSITALVTLADLYRLAGDLERAGQWIEQAQRLGTNSQAVVHARFLWLVAQKRWADLADISAAYLSAQEQDPKTVLRAASTLLAGARGGGSQERSREAV